MKSLWAILLTALFLTTTHMSHAEEAKMIEDGSAVTMEYVLTVKGEVADTSEGRGPLEFTQGKQMIIPGLESQLIGLKAGEKKNITVAPKDAYGEYTEELLVDLPKDRIDPSLDLQIGMLLQTQTPQGQPLTGVIRAFDENTVTLDFNHPLAGQELVFDVEILSVE